MIKFGSSRKVNETQRLEWNARTDRSCRDVYNNLQPRPFKRCSVGGDPSKLLRWRLALRRSFQEFLTRMSSTARDDPSSVVPTPIFFRDEGCRGLAIRDRPKGRSSRSSRGGPLGRLHCPSRDREKHSRFQKRRYSVITKSEPISAFRMRNFIEHSNLTAGPPGT